MNMSSSTERSVWMAAATTEVIDWGSCGISGRNMHSYSWRVIVSRSTIGWKTTWWSGSQAEEVVEHLGLHDLRALRHPDALGDPGDLDRGGHGEEVPLRLRPARIDHHEAVFGEVGDTFSHGPDGRLGEDVRRADHDRAGVQFEHMDAVDEHRDAVHEADVAGPEEPLGILAARTEEAHVRILGP